MRLLLLAAFVLLPAGAQSYVKDVYPIWEKYCLGCHTAGTKMGSLDIETWEGLLRGGNHGTILVPGDLQASRLYTMLIGEGKPAMPMDGNVLNEREIDIVRRWIVAGAPAPSPAEIAELKRRAAGESAPVSSLAWRPDGGELAVGRQGIVELVDVATRQVRGTLEGLAGAVGAVAYSPDGQRLAATGGPGKDVLIWDLARRAVATRLRGAPPDVRALIFSPDGERLIAASSKTMVIWELATGRVQRTLPVPGQAIQAIALSPDGARAVTAGADRMLRTWRLGEDGWAGLGESTARLPLATAVAWSPDGAWVAVAGASVRLFAAAGLAEGNSLAASAGITAMAWSPDGQQLVLGGPELAIISARP